MKLDLGESISVRLVRHNPWGGLRDSLLRGLRFGLEDTLRINLWDSLWESLRGSLGGSLWDTLRYRRWGSRVLSPSER